MRVIDKIICTECPFCIPGWSSNLIKKNQNSTILHDSFYNGPWKSLYQAAINTNLKLA